MRTLFREQERLARTKQTLQDLETESRHFEAQFVGIAPVRARKDIDSDTVLHLWHECEALVQKGRGLSWAFLFWNWLWQGLAGLAAHRRDPVTAIALLQGLFYKIKRQDLLQEIREREQRLARDHHERLLAELQERSLSYLRAAVFARYGQRSERPVFDEDFWKRPLAFQSEYPIVLSTNFSARSSLGTNAQFDYVIIDEASQVDVATGALALSCAKNAVIVGDAKQLPNVIPDALRRELEALSSSYRIAEPYRYESRSFLQSVCDALPGVPQTLLREHYRCHPRIIHFCNQKFYEGNLVILTRDGGEQGVVSVTKTVVGNHVRERVNQRQIEVFLREVLPGIPLPDQEIGVIAPYNRQVDAVKAALGDRSIDVATVHKFQGREKNAIVLFTVDDNVTDFSDDPLLLNVAVSRAKKSLHVIASANEQPHGSNLGDLLHYIAYHEGAVTESAVSSVFDFLYQHYAESREHFLKSHGRISEYDSENLMHGLIQDVLREDGFSNLGVVFQQPLARLLRDQERLNDDERRYASHPSTHVDFLIYHRFSKAPLLAIEVDGSHFHKEGTVQSRRDSMKDDILARYGIPLCRFQTNGSGERESLVAQLTEMLR